MLRIRFRIDPDWFWSDGSGSGSRRENMTHNNRKSEEFSCIEGWRLLLYLGRPRSLDSEKTAIFDQKNIIKFFSCKFFFNFLVIKSLELDPDPYGPIKCWIRILIGTNADPHHHGLRLGMASWCVTKNTYMPSLREECKAMVGHPRRSPNYPYMLCVCISLW